MNDWIQIITFTYPHEAHIAKGKLESEGISVEIRDELTAHVYNFYSNAIGGVKLFVKEKDFERANQILIEGKFIIKPKQRENKFLKSFDKFTKKIPFIGKSILEIRLIVFIMLILTLITIIIYILTLPSKFEKLTNNTWCVDNIYYLGKELKTKSTGIRFISDYDNCFETMTFRKNGIVTFPGLNSAEDWCLWKLENDKLIISDYYTEKSIFIGKYNIDIDNNNIRMQSDSLIIIGTKYSFNYSFQ